MANLLEFAIYRLSFSLFCFMNCKFGKKLHSIVMESEDIKIRHISNNLIFVSTIGTFNILSTFAECS